MEFFDWLCVGMIVLTCGAAFDVHERNESFRTCLEVKKDVDLCEDRFLKP